LSSGTTNRPGHLVFHIAINALLSEDALDKRFGPEDRLVSTSIEMDEDDE
jgi:hypothetical protein